MGNSVPKAKSPKLKELNKKLMNNKKRINELKQPHIIAWLKEKDKEMMKRTNYKHSNKMGNSVPKAKFADQHLREKRIEIVKEQNKEQINEVKKLILELINEVKEQSKELMKKIQDDEQNLEQIVNECKELKELKERNKVHQKWFLDAKKPELGNKELAKRILDAETKRILDAEQSLEHINELMEQDKEMMERLLFLEQINESKEPYKEQLKQVQDAVTAWQQDAR